MKNLSYLGNNLWSDKLSDFSKNFVPPKGSDSPLIYFVGEAPGYEEDKQGKPFVGRAGQFLDATLEDLNINMNDIRIFNAIPFRPISRDKGKIYNRPPTSLEIEHHRGSLIEDIKKTKPKCIVALGSVALKALKTEAGSMGSLRGRRLKSFDSGINGSIIYGTYHPSFILRTGGKKSPYYGTFKDDLNLVVSPDSDNRVDLSTRPYETFDVFKHLDRFLEKFSIYDEIVMDYETSGLDLYAKDFRLAGISFSSLDGVAGYLKFYDFENFMLEDQTFKVSSKITDFLKSRKRIIVYNASYEINVTRRFFSGIPNSKFYDVMSGIIAFHPKRFPQESYTLKDTFGRICPTILASDWTSKLLEYRSLINQLTRVVYPKHGATHKEVAVSNLKRLIDAKSKSFGASSFQQNNYSISSLVPETESISSSKSIEEKLFSYFPLLDRETIVRNLSLSILNFIDKNLKESTYPLTHFPLKVCSGYAILDSLATKELYLSITKESSNYEKGSSIMDIYNIQSIMAADLTRGGLAWDDEKAEEIKIKYGVLALQALKSLILHKSIQEVLGKNDKAWLEKQPVNTKDEDAQAYNLADDKGKEAILARRTEDRLLSVQTSTDIPQLKSIFNPASFLQVKEIILPAVYTPKVIFCRLIRAVARHYSYSSDGCREWYPFLTSIYEEMLEAKTFEARVNMVRNLIFKTKEANSLFNQKYSVALQNEGRYLESCNWDKWDKTDKKGNFLLARNNSKIKPKYLSYNDVRLINSIRLEKFASCRAELIEDWYNAIVETYHANLDDENTWIDEFGVIYYFRLYKKIMKSMTSYIDSSIGRSNVHIVNKKVLLDNSFPYTLARYGERDIDKEKELYLLRGTYLPNMADTKRWRSGLHTLSWNTELMDIRIPKFDNGIRIKWDYSQMEVVVLATLAQDNTLLETFREGKDIHMFVAEKIFGIPKEKISEAMRRFAKGATFSILYGKSPQAFATSFMSDDLKSAEDLFSSFFDSFPKIQEWIFASRRSAIKDGYVRTMFGDKIYIDRPLEILDLPEHIIELFIVGNKKAQIKSGLSFEAIRNINTTLRLAQNYPIQSTASTLAALGIYRSAKLAEDSGLSVSLDCFTHDAGEVSLKMKDLPQILNIIYTQSIDSLREDFGDIPVNIDFQIAIRSNHSLSISNIDINERKMAFAFSGKLAGASEIFDRMRSQNIKIDFNGGLKNYTKQISYNELFTSNRGYTMDVGKDIPMVKGKVVADFSNAI